MLTEEHNQNRIAPEKLFFEHFDEEFVDFLTSIVIKNEI